MKISVIIGSAFFSVLCLTGAGAQPALTLQVIQEQAVARSNTVRQAALAVDSAALGERLQALERLPSLSAQARAGLSQPAPAGGELADSFTASAGLTISQTLFEGGRQAGLSRRGALETTAAREDWRAAYLDALDASNQTYYGALEAGATLEAARSDLEAARQRQAMVEGRLETGMAARTDYLEARADTAAREAVFQQARGAFSVAMARIASLTGLEPPFTLESIDFSRYEGLRRRLEALDEAAAAGLASTVLGSAFDHNPALRQARLARESAAAAVELEKAGYRPSVSASLSQSLSYGPREGLENGGAALGLGVSIPLDLWNRNSALERAGIAVSRADLAIEEKARTLALDIQSAVFDLIASARSITSSSAALEYAEEYYRNLLELYRLSSSTASELSAAEALVSSSRTGLIEARYRFLSSLSALRTLAGLETEEGFLEIMM